MILHITNDFSNSTVYKNLISELDNKGLEQIVYNPVNSVGCIGRNKVNFKVRESSIIYSNILNKHLDRILFKTKINKILSDVELKVNINTINAIHAHTWFSNGAIAYELFKKYRTPYIIAIRNTDLNLFWRLPYIKSYGLKILKSASKIILISESYKNRALEDCKIRSCIEFKYTVIPNGVDPFWLKNSVKRKHQNNLRFINILYVGNFSSGKNVVNLIKAVLKINTLHDNIKLSLVGGGGNNHKKVLCLINENLTILKYYGKVDDKNELLAIYRNHQIFAMPSKHETFGLVYIEALLQGLPILYTKGEGVDGLYGKEVGEAVENSSIVEIELKLSKLINNLYNYDYNVEKIKTTHNWKIIAEKYNNLYKLLLKDCSME